MTDRNRFGESTKCLSTKRFLFLALSTLILSLAFPTESLRLSFDIPGLKDISPVKIFFILYIALIGWMIIRGRISLTRTPLDVPIWIFVGAILLSALINSSNRALNVLLALVNASAMLIYYGVYQIIKEREDLRRIFRIVGVFGLVIASFGLLEWVGGDTLDDLFQLFRPPDPSLPRVGIYAVTPSFTLPVHWVIGKTLRVSGTMPNPHTLGLFLTWSWIISLILCYEQYRVGERIRLALFGILSLFLWFILVLTRSWGALIYAGVSFLFLYKCSVRKHRRDHLFYLPVLLVAFLSWAAITLAPGEIRPGEIRSLSAQDRLEILRTAVRMGSDHPLIGIGPYNFRYLLFHTAEYRIHVREYLAISEPHNFYLFVLLAGGIPALLSMFYMFGLLLKNGLLAMMHGREVVAEIAGSIALVVGFLVYGLVGFNLLNLQLIIFFWFLIGIGAASLKLAC